ncbi:glycosyltransferase family 2 protein [Leptospira levettii]|uniref:Glycosyltransferase family 2 protein n=1 Tax=Leptospira levettii TaxID=2023178 RepID=A0AAW5V901_9LEPT|nr:glycosyltransferase family 2 protein [Leptospira levettii]MCW7466214.1 glycosyltransferase family 2 protein [Leptospira levettii]MCW7512261.1 glycosyltransferase family 2 protein [Leptospira levettii]MCW7516269.1 glycosyltransferase family 2 protein [Leptospira levettii]
MISVISPIYNEAENIEELCVRLTKALRSTKEDYEILLVENGSWDDSLKIIKDLRKKNRKIKYVSLSRNFGHQGGIMAGINHAKGNVVISLDGDLQHPPELIPEMVQLWKKGYDVVFTLKKGKAEHDNWRFLPSAIFYRVMNLFSEVKLSYGQSDFRLMDRKVIEVIKNIPEKNLFLRGMVEWVGFKQIGIKYDTLPRKKGESKFRLGNYIKFALDGIFSFSILPLRGLLYSGLLISLFCVLYAVSVILVYFLRFEGYDIFIPRGWGTLALGLVFFSSVQLIGIGILGEYIGRIYTQVKRRPDFIVKEESLD